MTNRLNKHVLILNQNYEPMSVCNAQKAVILIFLGKAEIVERRGNELIRSVSTAIPYPSVVRLSFYVRIPQKRIILSRKNILKRDGHHCQYCGTSSGLMTVDHVIPKIQNGKDSWENLVTACMKCNNKKGDRTPEQSGMKLIRIPRKPNHLTFIQHFIGVSDERWKPYLFLN
jgi:5-methylcytosine-specific restriction endonuclease McrA